MKKMTCFLVCFFFLQALVSYKTLLAQDNYTISVQSEIAPIVVDIQNNLTAPIQLSSNTIETYLFEQLNQFPQNANQEIPRLELSGHSSEYLEFIWMQDPSEFSTVWVSYLDLLDENAVPQHLPFSSNPIRFPSPSQGTDYHLFTAYSEINGLQSVLNVIIIDKDIFAKKRPAATVNRQLISSPDVGLSVFPNPANEQTTLRYSLNEPAVLSLRLIDLRTGQLLHTLLDGVRQEEGAYTLESDLHFLPPGSYVYELLYNGQRQHLLFNKLE